MNKSYIKLIIPAILIALACVNAHAYDNGDFQIWNTNGEEVRIYKDVKFAMEQEFRYGNSAGELFYQHYDFVTPSPKTVPLPIGIMVV